MAERTSGKVLTSQELPWIMRRIFPRLTSALEDFCSPCSPWKGLWVETVESASLEVLQVAWALQQISLESLTFEKFYPRLPIDVSDLQDLSLPHPRKIVGLAFETPADWVGRWCCEAGQEEKLKFQCGAIHEARGGFLLAPLSACPQAPEILGPALKALHEEREDWSTLDPWALKAGRLPPFLAPLKLKQQWLVVGHAHRWLRWVSPWPEVLKAQWMPVQLEHLFKLQRSDDSEIWETFVHTFLAWACPEIPLTRIQKVDWISWGRESTQSHRRLPLSLGPAVRLLKRLQDGNAKAPRHWRGTLRRMQFERDVEMAATQEAFLDGEMMIELSGSRVGEICGLAVAQGYASEVSWGAPFRLTCRLYHGDGELIDVDGKAGLGGHLHQKGMAILQAYLRGLLAWDHPWPFNASITSEQTYENFDGDSASLAGFCCWFSALSEVPLRQGVAVTGSMNQWGEVQVVGGVAEKVLGFWEICAARGFPPGCGVLLPWKNAQEVVLPPKVLASIQTGQFQWLPVRQALQALARLSGWSEKALISKLKERLEHRGSEMSGKGPTSESTSGGWRRWLPWLSKPAVR